MSRGNKGIGDKAKPQRQCKNGKNLPRVGDLVQFLFPQRGNHRIVSQKQHRKQSHHNAYGQRNPDILCVQCDQIQLREQGGADGKQRGQNLRRDAAGKNGRGRHDQNHGRNPLMGLLNSKKHTGYGRSRSDGKAGTGAARHGIPIPRTVFFCHGPHASPTDRRTHLDGGALVSQRHTDQKGSQGHKEQPHQIGDPTAGQNAPQHTDGGRNTAALQIGCAAVNVRKQKGHTQKGCQNGDHPQKILPQKMISRLGSSDHVLGAQLIQRDHKSR